MIRSKYRVSMVISAAMALLLHTPALADHSAGLQALKAKNYDVAMQEFTSGDAVGNAASQERVAHMYRKGRGVEKDKDEAIKWYRLAAEQGLSKAQFQLGFMLWGKGGIKSRSLKTGSAVDGDYKYSFKGDDSNQIESYQWMMLAASQGGALGMGNAKMMRVDMEINFDGMTQLRGERRLDQMLARHAFIDLNQRSDMGDATAQFELGMRYLNGEGTREKKKLAWHWLNLAWSNGIDDARKPAKKACKRIKSDNDDRSGNLDMRYMLIEYYEEHPQAFVGQPIKAMLKNTCR